MSSLIRVPLEVRGHIRLSTDSFSIDNVTKVWSDGDKLHVRLIPTNYEVANRLINKDVTLNAITLKDCNKNTVKYVVGHDYKAYTYIDGIFMVHLEFKLYQTKLIDGGSVKDA